MQRLNNTQDIKPGFQFKNNSMWLTVVLCDGTDKHNLALLVRENDACPYITARGLPETGNEDFDRAWGITSPILTRRSKIAENGFPNFNRGLSKV